MNERIRDTIAELVAQLHALYGASERSEFDRLVGRIQESVQSLSSTDSEAAIRKYSTYTPGVVTTAGDPPLYAHLSTHIEEANRLRIASAFLSALDTNPLIQPLDRLLERGGSVQILTSLMGFFNRPSALRAFLEWHKNLELRLYVNDLDAPFRALNEVPPPLHAKALMLEKTGAKPNLLSVGSANFTAAGLSDNIEWNYVSDFEVNAQFRQESSPYQRAVSLFEDLWNNHGYLPDDEFLKRYEELHKRARMLHTELRRLSSRAGEFTEGDSEIDVDGLPCPRPAQQTALHNMCVLRELGVRRFAIIAATGLGKTMLSAFEVRNAGAKRVLFIAHRDTILAQAQSDYKRVLPEATQVQVQGRASLEAVRGEQVHVFAMIQTLAARNNFRLLPQQLFDYIVVDEFHHASAESYKRVIEYFDAPHLLGMTATPERTDGQDVLELCDRQVAYEIRLLEAIDRKWLAPFQYYALYDPTDYKEVRWTGKGYDEEQLERALSRDTRARLVVNALRRYQPSHGKLKCLAFCSNVGHAGWMAKRFAEHGFEADTILGETPDPERAALLKRLADESGGLRIICAVDVLSEGVDVPNITHVLLLRPTQSFTVFLQQIGRGLRLHPDKDFVTVLDFVGNFRKGYVAPLALNGYHGPPPDKPRITDLFEFRPPRACYVSVDKAVVKLWRDEIRALYPPDTPVERLKTVIDELAGERNPSEVRLPELFTLDEPVDYGRLIRRQGGWLAVRRSLGIARPEEEQFAETSADEFLKHIEADLRPNRSYKMAVLKSLLWIASREAAGDEGDADASVRVEWTIDEIGSEFLSYYLSDRLRMQDWPELARSSDPHTFPLQRVKTHIVNMPLNYLSDDSSKFFTLDRKAGTFALIPSMHPFWRKRKFRDLVRERVEYAEALYWYRQNKNKAATD